MARRLNFLSVVREIAFLVALVCVVCFFFCQSFIYIYWLIYFEERTQWYTCIAVL